MANTIYSALHQPRRPIVYIEPTLSVKACVALMAKQNIGALVVVNEDGSLVGMVTEREVVRNCVHQGLDPNHSVARDIAYTQVSVLNIDEPLEHAMEVITKTKRRHILIQEKGELVAVLSIGDLLFNSLDDKTRVIEHLENYIHS
jgi:CBS domain-containing protein